MPTHGRSSPSSSAAGRDVNGLAWRGKADVRRFIEGKALRPGADRWPSNLTLAVGASDASAGAPGQELDRHSEATLCIVVSGTAHLQVGSSWNAFSEGHVLVIPPHVPHSGMGPHCRPGDPNPRDSVLLWIEFLPFCAHVHFCTTLDGEHSSGEGCYVLDAGLYESVNHLGAELRDRRAHHERIARDCLFRILLQVHRGIGEGAAFVSSGGEIEKMAGGSPTDIATRVERFLRANYNRHLTLRDICRGCYASRSLVCREFAKSEGAGVMKYLARLRVGVAKRLLASNLKVGEIARLVGFNDPYHFSRKFAQVEGISPRAWRRKHLSQKVRI